MRKILFIDRDGTLIVEPPVTYQVDTLEQLEFLPGVIGALSRVLSQSDYELVMVTNQDGLGTEVYPEENFNTVQKSMLQTFAGEGITFKEILIDKTFPEQNSPTRKPKTGLVEKYMNETLDYNNSYVIGDRLSDMELAKNMGIRGIYMGNGEHSPEMPVAFRSSDWRKIEGFLMSGARKAVVERKTKETAIRIEVDLNGTGKGRIDTGLKFFDHMLEQIPRHAGIDVNINVQGDLEVDEHHTIEDTGIALGECFKRALGSKRGVERYGFALPMDESEAQVLLDFGGRYELVWDVLLMREYVGDFPTEMLKHFFSAFGQACGCNLNIKAKGENTHHIIEAVFKALARAIRQAVRVTGTEIPSSKGVL